ncbi:multidrug effflux MFS transporter [Leptothrix discophora]|uniref:Bcr/CflA family efflux transporter n=1 Tax=Leptothrix discophora TaxID=89 RepID=A0ABT9G2C8_LEPDI|nr:multidrug effflux MFS transporter [Leptothrix discophora]MDP4300643.1 multidrug effflux MFS transporter [Leptothrix discophora]
MQSSPPTTDLAAARPTLSRARFTATQAAITLALCLGLQPATTDLYLPALPLLTRELGTSVATAQLTMSTLILAFGLAQLIWGPVADRVGRRPVLLTGIVLYTLAVLAGMLAPNIGLLIAARGAQGAALAALVVVARAMVRDLYAPAEGTRVMSWAMSGLGLIAIASPLLGGWVTSAWGWRAPFAVVALLALTLAAWVWARVPETVPQANPDALRPGPLLASWRRILGNRNFQAWAALTSGTYAGLFLFLAGSPFVYINVLGLSPAQYGVALCSSSVAYLAGTFMCRRWLLAHGAAGAVQRAAWWTLAGGLSLAALAWAGVQTVWAVLLPQLAYAFAHGTHQSCGQAGAVSHFPREAGGASALAGFLLALVAFGVGNLLGLTLDQSTRPLAYGIALAAVLTTAVAWTLVRRHGHAPG